MPGAAGWGGTGADGSGTGECCDGFADGCLDPLLVRIERGHLLDRQGDIVAGHRHIGDEAKLNEATVEFGFNDRVEGGENLLAADRAASRGCR